MNVHELKGDPFEVENCSGPTKPDDFVNELKPRNSLCQRNKILIGILVLCIAVAIAASVAPSRENSSFNLLDPSSWLPSLLDHLDYNPHGGDSPYDFSLWNMGRGCHGLDIGIIDNLEERWKPFLKTAVFDWDNGEPDAITINVREISRYDPECSPVRNLLKVCNGDYGSTDWVGVNIALVIDGFISSSVAKMNDYHLNSMSDGAKQWTMCHELGHGFGLGHWDERFHNRDLGNCMDYTSRIRKESNQKPDTSNFEFLELMYGNVDKTSVYSPTSVVNGTDKLHCKSSDLFERERTLAVDHTSDREYARYLKHMGLELDIDLDKSSFYHPHASLGWRYLGRTKYRQMHELQIEDGIKIVVSYHLA